MDEETPLNLDPPVSYSNNCAIVRVSGGKMALPTIDENDGGILEGKVKPLTTYDMDVAFLMDRPAADPDISRKYFRYLFTLALLVNAVYILSYLGSKSPVSEGILPSTPPFPEASNPMQIMSSAEFEHMTEASSKLAKATSSGTSALPEPNAYNAPTSGPISSLPANSNSLTESATVPTGIDEGKDILVSSLASGKETPYITRSITSEKKGGRTLGRKSSRQPFEFSHDRYFPY